MMNTIAGAGRAYLLANTRLRIRGLPQLYCPPDFPLNGSNYADIAIEQYERDKSILIRFPLLKSPRLMLWCGPY